MPGRRTLLALAGATAVPRAGIAQGAGWAPARALRMVVPYAPGSATDAVSRILAERVRETLGQAVVVENRPGSGGVIGTEAAVRGAPDGHTLLMAATGVLAIAPHLYATLPFSVERDLLPVSMTYTTDLVVCVSNAVAARTLAELVALARARPGALTFASTGAGATGHVASELFRLAAGIDILHVPYRGSGPAMADFVAGRVDIMVDQVAGPITAIQEGRVRALAVTGARRHKLLPEVPTVSEAGVPGAESSSWGAMLVPAGTPGPAVARLSEALRDAAAHPATRGRIEATGVDAAASTPEELLAFLRRETVKWGRVVRDARISLG